MVWCGAVGQFRPRWDQSGSGDSGDSGDSASGSSPGGLRYRISRLTCFRRSLGPVHERLLQFFVSTAKSRPEQVMPRSNLHATGGRIAAARAESWERAGSVLLART